MPLYLLSLERAIESLEEAVRITQDKELAKRFDTPVLDLMKSGVIRRFGITFRLAARVIQVWTHQKLSPEHSDPRTKRTLFRVAAQQGLIANPEHWFQYHKDFLASSRTYDKNMMETVFNTAVRFTSEVRSSLEKLRGYD